MPGMTFPVRARLMLSCTKSIVKLFLLLLLVYYTHMTLCTMKQLHLPSLNYEDFNQSKLTLCFFFFFPFIPASWYFKEYSSMLHTSRLGPYWLGYNPFQSVKFYFPMSCQSILVIGFVELKKLKVSYKPLILLPLKRLC